MPSRNQYLRVRVGAQLQRDFRSYCDDTGLNLQVAVRRLLQRELLNRNLARERAQRAEAEKEILAGCEK